MPIDEVRFPKNFTDVFGSPKEAHNKDIEKAYRKNGWEVVVVPKREHTPAREIRSKILSGEPCEHLVPAGTAEVIKAYSNI